jgi:hypothetical protein
VRRFVVPLHRAAPDFDLSDLPRGRVDVGCRCLGAALFRSQALRHNTEVRLCFGGVGDGDDGAGEGATVCVSGGLVRNLAPDEQTVARRLRCALARAGCAPSDESAHAAVTANGAGGAAAASTIDPAAPSAGAAAAIGGGDEAGETPQQQAQRAARAARLPSRDPGHQKLFLGPMRAQKPAETPHKNIPAPRGGFPGA